MRAFVHSLAAGIDEARNQIRADLLSQILVRVNERDLHGRHRAARCSNALCRTDRNGAAHLVDDVFHRLFLQLAFIKPEVIDDTGQSGAAQNTLGHAVDPVGHVLRGQRLYDLRERPAEERRE